MSSASKANKLLKSLNISIVDLSEKKSKKGYILSDDTDNLVLTVGFRIGIDKKENTGVCVYTFALKNPKDRYISRISKFLIGKRFQNGQLHAFHFPLEEYNKVSNEDKIIYLVYLIFLDLANLLTKKECKIMVLGSKLTTRLQKLLLDFINSDNVRRILTKYFYKKENNKNVQNN